MRIKDNFRRLKQLTYILIFSLSTRGWENFMDLLIGTLFLILVLIILHYLRIKRLTECVRWEHWQTRLLRHS